MPSASADDLPLLEFATPDAWRAWLHEYHATQRGAWVKFAKRGAPRQTIDYAQALEVALCYGWIDSQVRRLDESFYRQRFTPRGRRSRWSQINREKAIELIERGLMQGPGLAEVRQAQADGRWEAAYASPSRAAPPRDFLDALAENPTAADFYSTLSSANRYALIFRIEEAKRPQTRARRIAKFVEMLEAHQTFH